MADAADFAIFKGWIFADEKDSLLASATQNALQYPGVNHKIYRLISEKCATYIQTLIQVVSAGWMGRRGSS